MSKLDLHAEVERLTEGWDECRSCWAKDRAEVERLNKRNDTYADIAGLNGITIDTLRASVKALEETLANSEGLAKSFHEAYERLAPAFSYKTREASAVPWEDVPEDNRRLMIAVCMDVFAALRAPEKKESER